MTNPYVRERLTTIALAAVIIAAAVLAWPGGDSPEATTADDVIPATNARTQDFGYLTQERRVGDAASQQPVVSPELADTRHASPLDPDDIREAAEVATRFAVEFASWRYDETIREREARLEPLLTERGRTSLSGGSSAAAELEDQRRRREVATAELAFLEPIDVTTKTATLLVALRVTVTDLAGSHTNERAFTVHLRPENDGQWAVDRVEL